MLAAAGRRGDSAAEVSAAGPAEGCGLCKSPQPLCAARRRARARARRPAALPDGFDARLLLVPQLLLPRPAGKVCVTIRMTRYACIRFSARLVVQHQLNSDGGTEVITHSHTRARCKQ